MAKKNTTPMNKTMKKTMKTPTKKITKEAARKVTSKATSKATRKATSAPKAKAAAARISVAKVTPSRDGLRWTVALSDGASHKVSSAAAQSLGIAVGGAWGAGTLSRVAGAEKDQELFKRAMAALAKRGKMEAPTLEKLLGGDPRAKRTVAALRRNGWIA